MLEDRIKEIEEMNKKLLNMGNEMKTNKNRLVHELSITDKKILDIQHYIEIYNLNAAEGYKAYKLLKETLEERRKIKDELKESSSLSSSLCTSGNIINQSVTNAKQRLENRHYKVRIMKEIFGETMGRS